MNRTHKLIGLFLLAMGVVSIVSISGGQEGDKAVEAEAPPAPPGTIEPEADRILREMSDYLKAADEFTFHAEITYDDVRSSGQKIQYGGQSDISVRRPDRLHAKYNGDERKSRIFYDGKTFTIHDAVRNLYAVTEVPPKIDSAIDQILEKYGFTVPIADLLYADPYASLTGNVQSASVIGTHAVDGAPCRHLAFTQAGIDWQIWIAEDPKPVPRKLVITYKDEPGSPQYTARLSAWNVKPQLQEKTFTFDAPAGASPIEFLPIRQKENE